MFLKNLNLLNFRSYPSLTISFPPEGALFEGLNGVGKTNLLEAIHMLCTGRSQRGAARTDIIAHGENAAFAEGEFYVPNLQQAAIVTESPQDSQQDNIGHLQSINTLHGSSLSTSTVSIGFSRDKKIIMKRDGSEVRALTDWFGDRPIVSFGTDDLELVYGAPETRRRFLDMLISQIDRAYLCALTKYRRNMANRNALLGRTDNDALFEVYEQAMAEAGAEVVFRRAETIEELRTLQRDFYAQISENREIADVAYLPKYKYDLINISDWRNVYFNTLVKSRKRDAELMYTAYGPHRDDLRFTLDDRPAKSYASQGQCRSFALALKLGAVQLFERCGKNNMIFLIDDAVSELDPERTSRVYPLLEGRGQIFIATPRCLAKLGSGVMKYTVESGGVVIRNSESN